MKILFYPRLAVSGIKKNSKLYLPYMLTCAGMVTMFYILHFLSVSDFVGKMRGGHNIQMILNYGVWIIGIFSLIFLFYTNSFLMRRRKKEFGLYNILGMGKGNIARILAWETLVSSAASFVSGCIFGIALSKFAEFALSRLANSEVEYRFYVSTKSIGIAAACFSGIFTLIYLNSVLRIRLSDPIALFKSENAGEKPPKGNVFFGAAGVVLLAAAYAIALSLRDPIEAFIWFYAAVIMVIVATYLLFVSGSVIICRLLQRNKRYYYKLSHFVSVSSMTYRMKRNGAGLASICILVTMVLVMISASAGLYFGVEDSLRASCPRNFILRTDVYYTDERASGLIGELRDDIFRTADENGIDRKSIADYRLLALFCRGGEAISQSGSSEFLFSDSYCRFYFYSAEDYAALSGQNAGLSDGEILLYASYGGDFGETLEFKSLGALSIKEQVGAFDQISGSIYLTTIPTFCIVVSDLDQTADALSELALLDENASLQLQWYCAFDSSADQDVQISASEKFRDVFRSRTESLQEDESGISSYSVQSAACSRDDFYGTFGGIFCLGIMLGLVFTTSAVLIIYYKQISEGFEDQARFDTMKKVGMTSRDIRKSINSQMLTVFFLPLAAAGLHLAFAFPMVSKLLTMFNLKNTGLLVFTTVASFLIFAVLYVIVYRITSNAYFRIVNGKESE